MDLLNCGDGDVVRRSLCKIGPHKVENVPVVVDKVDVDALPDVVGQLDPISLVVLGQQHYIDGRPLGRDHLLPHAADGKDFPGERHLPGHGEIGRNRPVEGKGDQRGDHRAAG